MTTTYYDALGVEATADVEVIERAYLTRAAAIADGHGAGGASGLGELHEAWNTLSDVAARARYDAELARRFPARYSNPRPSADVIESRRPQWDAVPTGVPPETHPMSPRDWASEPVREAIGRYGRAGLGVLSAAVGASLVVDGGVAQAVMGCLMVVGGLGAAGSEATCTHRLRKLMTTQAPNRGVAQVVQVNVKTLVISRIPHTHTTVRPFVLVTLDDGSEFRYRLSAFSPRWLHEPVSVWRDSSKAVVKSTLSGVVLWPVGPPEDPKTGIWRRLLAADRVSQSPRPDGAMPR